MMEKRRKQAAPFHTLNERELIDLEQIGSIEGNRKPHQITLGGKNREALYTACCRS